MTFDLQSFQGASRHGLKGLIARSPPSRLLNLHALRKSLPEDPGYATRPFFHQPILNRSIIVKHNMRNGEESLDGKRQLNALKFIFPFDASNLSFGAQSLLTSQIDLASNFQRLFESDQLSTERDLKLIAMLDEAPTLDPFLLQEIVKQNGFDVAPCYFAANRQVLRHQSAIVAAEVNPILELFGSNSPLISGENLNIADIQSAQDNKPKKLQYTFTNKKEYEQKLSECFYNWKFALFYRLRLTELTSATKHLIVSVERLRTNIGATQTTPTIERSRRRVYDVLASALSEAQMIVEDYDLLHYAVLNSARPDLFCTLLKNSKMYNISLGARISRLDDALGFWAAHAPGGPDRVETYILESFMQALDRHIGTDLPLPTFVQAAPLAGIDGTTKPTIVTSRLRSDLQG